MAPAVSSVDPANQALQCLSIFEGVGQIAPKMAVAPTLLPIAEIRTAYRNATPVCGGRPEVQRASAVLLSSLNLYLPSLATLIFSA
jgi:hypothetical protein